MKQFLQRALLFLLPVLGVVALSEWLLRKIPNDYSLKAGYYRQHGNDIRTLILGNSYAYYDLDPAFFRDGTFNGGHVAQTLDLDAAIFDRYSAKMDNLRTVILTISDMSFFWRLAGSEESWRMKNYFVYYKLPGGWNITDRFEVLDLPFAVNRYRLPSWYGKGRSAVSASGLGYGTDYNSASARDLTTSAVEAVRVHTIAGTAELTTEKKALEQIIAVCRERNIRVVLLIPPVSRQYRARMPFQQRSLTLDVCDSIRRAYKNVSYFNFWDDPSFTENDYFDADHLNERGAKKLSVRIDSLINQ